MAKDLSTVAGRQESIDAAHQRALARLRESGVQRVDDPLARSRTATAPVPIRDLTNGIAK